MQLSKGYSQYGADMGRPSHVNNPGDLASIQCYLLPVALDRGGYDPGGAYWGTGTPLWRIFSAPLVDRFEDVVSEFEEAELVDCFLRAEDKAKAEAKFRTRHPDFPLEIVPYLGELPVEEFLDAYIEAAFWSSTYTVRDPDDSDEDDEAGETRPLDEDFGPHDLAEEARDSMRETCEEFLASNQELLLLAMNEHGYSLGRAGHDFWLTRNGHGTGFWDRGLGETGRLLTSEAKAYGTCDLEVGDDGQIHIL